MDVKFLKNLVLITIYQIMFWKTALLSLLSLWGYLKSLVSTISVESKQQI